MTDTNLKQYSIYDPVTQEQISVDVDTFEKNKDEFFQKYPQAQVYDQEQYNPSQRYADDDTIHIQMDGEESVTVSGKQFNANKDEFFQKFPNAQVSKVRNVRNEYYMNKAQQQRQQLDEFLDKNGGFLSGFEAASQTAISRYGTAGVSLSSPQMQYINENRDKYDQLSAERKSLVDTYLNNPYVKETYQSHAASAQELQKQYDEAKGNATTRTERQDYRRAAKLQGDIEKLWNAPSANEVDGFGSYMDAYMSGAAKTFSDVDFWTSGISAIARNVDIRNIQEKLQEGLGKIENPTEDDVNRILAPSEQALLSSFVQCAQAQAERSATIAGAYNAGMSAADSAGFMASFLISGGVAGLTSKGLSGSAKAMSTWVGRQLARNLATNSANVASKLALKGWKGAVTDYVTRPVAQAIWHTALQPQTYKSVSEFMTQTDDEGKLIGVGEAWLKGIGDSLIENWSEGMGAGVEKALAAPFKLAGKAGGYAFGKTNFGALARYVGSSTSAKVLKEAGFNGFVGEMGEEWLGNAVRVMTGLMDKEEFKDWATNRQLEMAASFAPMSLIGLGTSSADAIAYKKKYKNAAENARHILGRLGASDEQINEIFNKKYATPEDIANALSPWVGKAKEGMYRNQQTMDDYKGLLLTANLAAGNRTLEEQDKYEQQAKRDNIDKEISDSLQGKNYTLPDGTMRVINKDGKVGYITTVDASGLLTAEYTDGTHEFLTEDSISAGVESGKVADSGYQQKDEFLDSEVKKREDANEYKALRETQWKEIQALRQSVEQEMMQNNGMIEVGTKDAPQQGEVMMDNNPDGVTVLLTDSEGKKKTQHFTWAELAARKGKPITTKLASEIAEEQANVILQGDELRARVNEAGKGSIIEKDGNKYVLDRVVSSKPDGTFNAYVTDQNGDSVAIELTEDDMNGLLKQNDAPVEEKPVEVSITPAGPSINGQALPMKDGVVDEKALMNQDMSLWAEFNKTKPIKGTSSGDFIAGQINKWNEQKAQLIKERDAEINGGGDIDKINSLTASIQEADNRINELSGMLDKYATMNNIIERLTAWTERLGLKINVYKDASEIRNQGALKNIANGVKVFGWFDVPSRTVHIYAPDLVDRSIDEVDKTVMHEGVSHLGLRILLGEDGYNALCDNVFRNTMSEANRNYYLAYVGVNPADFNKLSPKEQLKMSRAAADEYIAKLAESVDTEERSWWRQIVDSIRTFLTEKGLIQNIDADTLESLLRNSLRQFEQEKAANREAGNELSAAEETPAQQEQTQESVQEEQQAPVDEYVQETVTRIAEMDQAKRDSFGYLEGRISKLQEEIARAEQKLFKQENSGADIDELKNTESEIASKQSSLEALMPLYNELRGDREPKTPEELAANVLAYHIRKGDLNREDFKKELGWGDRELNKFFGAWAPKGKGISVGMLAEEVVNANDEYGLPIADDMAARDVVLSVMQGAPSKGTILTYTRDANQQRRMEQQAQEQAAIEAARLAEEQAAQQTQEGDGSLDWFNGPEGDEFEQYSYPGSGTMFRKVTDPEVVKRYFEDSEVITGYRNVVMNEDGSFSSPMASSLRGNGSTMKTESFNMNEVEQAEEHPELANEKGKITLVKPDSKTVNDVDYNPYIHNRPTRVNLQFKQAWERPNLVYIQTEISKRDLDEAYHADKAAKSTGIHNWPSENSKQKLILSRYDRPVAIVPWEEVADDWAAELKDKGVNFDVVPPALRQHLVDRGIEILPPHKGMGDACNAAYQEWKEQGKLLRVNKKKIQDHINKQRMTLAEVDYLDLNSVPNIVNNSKNPILPGEDSKTLFSKVTPEQDAEYVKAYENNDVELARRMVSDAFKANYPNNKVVDKDGNPIVVYKSHRPGNTVAGYFTTDASFAEHYAAQGWDLGSYFINMENPYEEDFQGADSDGGKGADGKWRSTVHAQKWAIEAARENGLPEYDGFIFRNVDEYGYGSDDALSDDYITRKPNNVKSADPFTFDDNGNLIPLSERFNAESRDVRFRKDAEYMAAVEAGDMETAQKMVDELAEQVFAKSKVRGKDGKLIKVYHGTMGQFNSFDRELSDSTNEFGKGMYFSDAKSFADRYASLDNNPDYDNEWRVLERFEELGKQMGLDLGYEDTMDNEYIGLYNQAYDEVAKEGRVIAAYLNMENPFMNEGEAINEGEWDSNDGVIDSGFAERHPGFEGNQYVVFNPAQIKSAEAVTYDDQHNVIPLSERFNLDNDDIRFSKAFHGTSANFGQFDHSHIGEGEGHQAHGWGTYVAFGEERGRKYADKIATYHTVKADALTHNGTPVEYHPLPASYDWSNDWSNVSIDDIILFGYLRAKSSDPDQVYKAIWNLYDDMEIDGHPGAAKAEAAVNYYREHKDEYKMQGERHLYEVEIPDDNGSNYIDEDKAVPQEIIEKVNEILLQHPVAMAKLNSHNEEVGNVEKTDFMSELSGRRGKKFYYQLSSILGKPGYADDKEASRVLNEAGVVGIKYDGDIDGKCAVIFNDKDVKITDHTMFRKIQGLEGHFESALEDMVSDHINENLSEEDGFSMVGLRLIGSRTRNEARPDSDLDVLVQYDGDMSEDTAFNILNENPLVIDGITVDIFPINTADSGTIEDWIKAHEGFSKVNPISTEQSNTPEGQFLAEQGIASNGEEVRFSREYVPSADKWDDIVKAIVSETGVTEDKARQWLTSETSLGALLFNELYAPYALYEADDRYKAIKTDSDYPQGTVDFNNICRKRVGFSRMYQRLQKEYPNKIITGEDLAIMRQILKDANLMVACGLCYVEDRRQLMGEVAASFIKNMQTGFESYMQGEGGATASDTKKKNAEKFISMIGEDKYIPTIYDLITVEGSMKLYEEHPGIFEAFNAFNSSRGQQAQNLFQGYAEYKREILKWNKKKVRDVNANGGLRIFSYSDFEAHHLIDLVQIIQDCARKGVMIQGYTKVPAFARAIAATGIKLNRSLIPAGDLGYHMEGDKVVLDFDPVEGIDVNDADFLESNNNVGNILIGINDTQIRAAMLDPFVHYIIPYHSNQSGVLRGLKGTGAWTNYKLFQTDKPLPGSKEKGGHGVNIYKDILIPAEEAGRPIRNDVEFVETFLAECKKRKLKPRFDAFLDRDENGEYIYTPGYYKFLVDYKLFDDKGRILPQRPVTADFDDEFNKTILDRYVAEEKASEGEEYDEVYDKVKKTLGLDKRQDATLFRKIEITPEVRKEMNLIGAQALLNGTYMKAPNGADTHLNAEQWKLVRTKAFKDWFGDWELVAYLLGNNYAAELTGDEFAADGRKLTDKVPEFYQLHYGGLVHREGLGDVILDKQSVKSSIAHGIGRNKAIAFAAVPDIIKNGRIIEESENWKNRGYKGIAIAAPIQIKGEGFVAVVILTKGNNADSRRFYLHEVMLQKNLQNESIKTGIKADSHKGDVANLLKNILNASKVVDENGEPMVVYHTSTTDYVDGEFVRFNEFNRGYARNGFFFSDSEQFSDAWAGTSEAQYKCFMNLRNPRIEDAKGAYWSEIGSVIDGVNETDDLMRQAEEQGYDGVILRNVEEGGAYTEVLTDYVAFSANQIKSVDNSGEFSNKNNDIRFRKKTPAADEKTLVGMHNISVRNLRAALRNGGLANPSVAVVDIAKRGHNEFGDISLILPSQKVDSRTGDNAGTWTDDVWTPTYPKSRTMMTDEGYKNLREAIAKFTDNPEMYNAIESSELSQMQFGSIPDLMWLYLHEVHDIDATAYDHPGASRDWTDVMLDYKSARGFIKAMENEDNRKKYTRLITSYVTGLMYKEHPEMQIKDGQDVGEWLKQTRDARKAFIAQYADEDGRYSPDVIKAAFNKQKKLFKVNGAFNYKDTKDNAWHIVAKRGWLDDYYNWVDNRIHELGAKTELNDGVDRNGNAKWVPDSVWNASRIMNKKPTTGNNALGGWGTFIAQLAKHMNLLGDIRDRKSLLGAGNDENNAYIRDNFSTAAITLNNADPKRFELWDGSASKGLAKIVAKGRNAEDYIKNTLRLDLSDEDLEFILEFVQSFKDRTVDYFETKFTRPVNLNEFAAAVVPEGLDQDLMDALDQNGLNVVTYKLGDKEDMWKAQQKASEQEGIRFRKAFHGSKADFDSFDHSKMGTGEGAQAHGWGTYVAFNEDTSRGYAIKLAGTNDYTRLSRLIADNEKLIEHSKSIVEKENAIYNSRYASYEAYKAFKDKLVDDEIENLKKYSAKAQKVIDEFAAKGVVVTPEEIQSMSNLELFNKYGSDIIKLKAAIETVSASEQGIADSEEERRGYTEQRYEEDKLSFRDHIDAIEWKISNTEAENESLRERLKGLQPNRHLYTLEIPDDNGDNYLDEQKRYSKEEANALLDRIEKANGKFADEEDLRDDVTASEQFANLVDSLTGYDENGDPYIDRDAVINLRHKDDDFYKGFSVDYWGETLDIDSPAAAARYLGLKSRFAIDTTFFDVVEDYLSDHDSILGGRLYNNLTDYGYDDNNKMASLALSNAGFVGIKYDGRTDGDCAVIFQEHDAKIVEHTRFRKENTEQDSSKNTIFGNGKFGNNEDAGRNGKNRNAVSLNEAERMAIGRDRSDIGVFEERLASARREYLGTDQGDYEQRQAREVVSEILIETAQENGLYIEPFELKNLGLKYSQKTSESEIYYDFANKKVYKVKNPFAQAAKKKNSPFDAIYEHIVHNAVFPETRYSFEGISEKNGDVRIVLSQAYIDTDINATDADVENLLKSKGFVDGDNRYSMQNDDVTITDYYGANALADGDNVYIIDPIIGHKRSAEEILDETAGDSEIRFSRSGFPDRAEGEDVTEYLNAAVGNWMANYNSLSSIFIRHDRKPGEPNAYYDLTAKKIFIFADDKDVKSYDNVDGLLFHENFHLWLHLHPEVEPIAIGRKLIGLGYFKYAEDEAIQILKDAGYADDEIPEELSAYAVESLSVRGDAYEVINNNPDDAIIQQLSEFYKALKYEVPTEYVTRMGGAQKKKGGDRSALGRGEGSAVQRDNGKSKAGTFRVQHEFEVRSVQETERLSRAIASGLQPVMDRKELAAAMMDIFKGMPDELRRQAVEKFWDAGNFTDSVPQIFASLAEKKELTGSEVEAVNKMRDALADALGVDSMRAADALWIMFQTANAGNDDLLFAAKRAIVARNTGNLPSQQAAASQADSDIRFRRAQAALGGSAAVVYNKNVSFWGNRLHESFVDMYDSVKEMVQAIEESTGKKAEGFEDVLKSLNQHSSIALSRWQKYDHDYLKPLRNAIASIVKDKDHPTTYDQLERYLILKHGVERNAVLAKRDARKYYENLLAGQLQAGHITQDEYDQKLEEANNRIDAGTDKKYLELRENDYSGLTSMYSEYSDYGTRDDYNSDEEFNKAKAAARKPKYDNLADIESAAETEVEEFEQNFGQQTKDIWDAINKATKATLKDQWKSGMLTKDQYETIRDEFEYYVPLRGFKEDTAEDLYSYYTNNSVGFAAPVLSAKGRKTESESPIAWISSMASSAIAQNSRNEFKQALYFFVVNRPEQDLVSIQDVWMVDTGMKDNDGKAIFEAKFPTFSEDLSGDAAKAAYDAWEEQMKDLEKQGKAFRHTNRLDLKNTVLRINDKNMPEHAIRLKVNGRDVVMYVNANPRAAQAINGQLNIEANMSGMQEAAANVLRFLASVNTSYNPEFWISNAQRDVLFALMSQIVKGKGGVEFLKQLENPVKLFKMMKDYEEGVAPTTQEENWYKEFADNGGITGFSVVRDNEMWLKDLESELDPKLIDKLRTNGFVETFQRFGEAIEQMTRFAAFKQARMSGESVKDSVAAAKEITVNFNRKGSGQSITKEELDKLRTRDGKKLSEAQRTMVKLIGSMPGFFRRMYMFFNASVQGLNAMAGLIKENPSMMGKWAAGYFALGVMNALIHSMLDDDDDYLDLPEYERRNNLLLGAKGIFVKWALPQESRVFYAMGDMLVNHSIDWAKAGKTPREPQNNIFFEALQSIGEAMPINPVGGVSQLAPTVLQPLVQLMVNEDYKGSQIYRDNKYLSEAQKNNVPAYNHAFSGTSATAKAISQGINFVTGGDDVKAGKWNLPPEILDFAFESAFGGVSRFGSRVVKTAEGVVDTAAMAAGAEDGIFGQDLTMQNIPFLNRVIRLNDDRSQRSHTRAVYNYYEGIAKVAKQDFDNYVAAGRNDKLNDLMNSNEWNIYMEWMPTSQMIKAYNKLLRIETDRRERSKLMAEQDQFRKDMLKKIRAEKFD